MKNYIIYIILVLTCFTKSLFAEKNIAIIVGVNQYLNLTTLSAADNDAQMMQQYLKDKKFKTYFLSENAARITNRPSVAALNKVMTNIENIIADEKPDQLIFYFSGHGVAIDGANYLAFPNAEIKSKTGLLNLDAKMIPWFRKISARQTLVFIDACREDISQSRSVKIKGIKVIKRRKVKSDGVFIVYAASPGGYSLEKADKSNGYFTENLLRGLKRNKSKTLLDLSKWLRKVVPKITEKETGYAQVPYIGGDYDPNAVFQIGSIVEKKVDLDDAGEEKTTLNKKRDEMRFQNIKRYRDYPSYGELLGKTLLLPGLGHFSVGATGRGAFYSIAYGVSGLGFLLSNLSYFSANNNYQSATSDFDALFNDRASAKSTRAAWSFAFFGVYTIALFDMLITGNSYTYEGTRNSQEIDVSFKIYEDQLQYENFRFVTNQKIELVTRYYY